MNQIKLLPSLIIFSVEKELGVQLLKRNTRGLSITISGEKLLRRCDFLKGQVDSAFHELANTEQQAKGTFSIIFPPPLEKDIMIPAISQLCREFPNLNPNITVTLEKRDLIKNKLDIAVFGGEPRDSDYRALALANTCEYFCATPEYISKKGAPKAIEDLKQHAWIANEWQKNPILITEVKDVTQKHSIKLNEMARSNSSSSTLAMTLEHLGISLLPNILCASLIEQGKLQRILPQYNGPEWPFYFIHPFKGEKPIHITRFYQLVKHHFSIALLYANNSK